MKYSFVQMQIRIDDVCLSVRTPLLTYTTSTTAVNKYDHQQKFSIIIFHNTNYYHIPKYDKLMHILHSLCTNLFVDSMHTTRKDHGYHGTCMLVCTARTPNGCLSNANLILSFYLCFSLTHSSLLYLFPCCRAAKLLAVQDILTTLLVSILFEYLSYIT